MARSSHERRHGERRYGERRVVGRAEALAVLEEAQARAKAGRTSTVLVGGSAGIGKPRLVREFPGWVGDACTLVGTCLELGEDAAACLVVRHELHQ